MKMDDVDLHILEELQKDSRLSMRELAKKVNLSAPSVTERVRRLEEADILKKYTIDINYEKLGLTVECYVEITMKNGEYERFKSFIAAYPYAQFCERIAGQACFITKLKLPHLQQLEEFINEVTPFAKTISHVVLSNVNMKSTTLHDLRHKRH
ncbi:Lrp/AsnC family transcriptional regulator [Metabacillus iocasae]|uniref:Lrp/AsnC family leucine-responsive transcriptional regulator n=1 Tax=Priestia iocasae TaxID=2291674 RepID=A0ABS2QVL7_9BACI|nr:Lrp/AsnC family transcriptional regulator [Metabacillus iocasae]MBM7703042.1 Lrp/AsnC family leucine-responsive transcriptional regulator [Metabacillus iocasae]